MYKANKFIKLLIISDYFLPGYRAGGPIISVANLCELLSNKISIKLFTRNHDLNIRIPYQENDFVKSNKYEITYFKNLNIFTIFKIIKKNKDHIFYLNSFFSRSTILVLLLRMLFFKGIKIIIAPRGELSPGAFSIKYRKKKIYLFLSNFLTFYKNCFFHATDEVEKKTLDRVFKNGKIFLIKNIFIRNMEDTSRQIVNKNQGELRILYASRITKKKNLKFSIELLSKRKVSNDRITFDIYGTIEDKGYYLQCKNMINKLPSNIVVNFKGEYTHDEIYDILSGYHIFLLPTFNENFGHAIVEAMSMGVIPLISDKTPWRNLQQVGCGWDITVDEPEKFNIAIDEALAWTTIDFTEISQNTKKYIAKQFLKNKIIEDYLKMFMVVSDS